jgi:hypothetical protein
VIVPQTLPPAEVRFVLQPAWRPWEARPVPSFRPAELRLPEPGSGPRALRVVRTEIPRPWYRNPLTELFIWVGLTSLSDGHIAKGSTWNQPFRAQTFRFEWVRTDPVLGH